MLCNAMKTSAKKPFLNYKSAALPAEPCRLSTARLPRLISESCWHASSETSKVRAPDQIRRRDAPRDASTAREKDETTESLAKETPKLANKKSFSFPFLEVWRAIRNAPSSHILNRVGNVHHGKTF
jgi:hypothetical protein